MSKINKLKFIAFATFALIQGTAVAASLQTLNGQSQQNNNVSVSTTALPSSNFTPMASIPSVACKLKGNPATCIPVGNLSILPLALEFPETDLGGLSLAQLALNILSMKTDKHDTEKVVIHSMFGKELYNGDAKNYVGVKCILNKCSDWD